MTDQNGGVGAGWREGEGWERLIVAHELGLVNFLALCTDEEGLGKVKTIAKCHQ